MSSAAMSGDTAGSQQRKSFIERMLPKEAQQFIQCFKPQGGDSPGSQSMASTSQRQKPLLQVEVEPQPTVRPEETLSPRHRKLLLNRARTAKDIIRHRNEEGTRKSSLRYWMVLMGTAVLSSLLSYSIDQATWSMGVVRHKFTTFASFDDLTIVTVFNVACVILARLIVRTTVEAEGSGFPEVKAMLFGKVMTSYLTLRVLFVKAIALALGVGAGLPLGKEGPNVHMAACISRTLGPRFYNKEKSQQVDASHLLLAACAVGVGSSFSAPIGGVVFSLELVLPQVFDYIGYTGCFLSAVTGSVCFAAYRSWAEGNHGLLPPLMSTDVRPLEGAQSEYPSVMILVDVAIGVICGLLGGLWIRLHAKVVGAFKRWRLKTPASRNSRALQKQISMENSNLLARNLLDESPKGKARGMFHMVTTSFSSARKCQWRDLFQIAVVVIVNTVCAASLPLLGGRPQPALLSHLFDKDLILNSHEWSIDSLGPHWTMFLCFLFKWTITIFALSLPNPAGVVAPTMIIGGLLGRCIGMAMPAWFVEQLLQMHPDTPVSEDAKGAFMARLAILGAAAFCAAVCRAFAMAITVFEVLALPNALLPLCSSSLAAMFVANKIALPYFDTNLVGRGLGGISALTHTKKAQQAVFTVMRRIDTRTDCLEVKTTLGHMRRMLQETEDPDIPIVQTVVRHWADEGVNGLIHASITRADLMTVVEQCGQKDPSAEVSLLDPAYTRPADASRPLVRCTPLQADPDALVQDVYLMMKITHAQVVFVARDNCLLGVVNFKELLGHKLNE